MRLSTLVCSVGLWALLAAGPMPPGAVLGLLLAVAVGLLLTRTARAATVPTALRCTGPVPATVRPVRVIRAFDPDTAGRSRPRAPGGATTPSA